MHPRKSRLVLGLAALALALAIVIPLSSGAAAHSKRVAKEVSSQSGQTLLANLKGRTLYSLSVEKHGRFICTGSCLQTWHPLLVPAGVRPTGPVSLGTVKRPEGRTQTTFRGRPLYVFAGDTGKGQTGGEGFKDVGTWHAVTLRSQATSPSPAPAPEPGPYPSLPSPGGY